jgi:hypothetical protein
MKKVFTLLTLALLSISTAWADPTYKSDFTNGQILWTTKANIDAAVTGGWMVLGGKMSGTKDLKNKLLINPETDEPYTSAPFTSTTNFYVEKAYSTTSSNDQSLYIYVTGVARIYFYAWCNSSPDGREMTITVNGVAKGSITYGTGTANAQYTSVVLTKAANNIIRINGTNEVELTAIKVETVEKSASSLAFETTSGTGDLKNGTSFALPTLEKTPSDATVTYTSSNESAATIDVNTGEVTLVSPGVTTITASFAGNSSYYPSSATYELTVINSAANTITVTYDVSGVASIEGTAPTSFSIDEGEHFTIPVNTSLYVDGKTLTGWEYNSTTYASGADVTAAATDMTLTPVFTENAPNAHLGYNQHSVTWNFVKSTGAPLWNNLQGVGATAIYVAQTNVGGSDIDVKMLMDATSGKIDNSSNDSWTQMNTGTVLTVPAIIGAEVKLYVYSSAAAATFNGNDGDFDSTNKIYSYTATADGDLDVVLGGNDYASKLVVTYPSETAVLTVSAANTKVGLAKTSINSVDYVTVATDNWGSNGTWAGYTGQFYNMSTNSRILTFKVTGANTFEVFVNNTTPNRKYTIKINDGSATEITHNGTGVESSGVFTIADPTATTTITMAGATSSSNSVYPIYINFDPAATIAPAKEYTTYVTSAALDFTGLDIKAYVATGASASEVTMVPVTTVPAGTPLVLKKGSAASYDVPVIVSAAAPATNKLVASDGVSSIGGDGNWDYILSNGMFYHASAGVLPAGKAYLHLDAEPSARELSLSFEDDETTGVADVRGKMADGRSEFFNLAGQRVAQPTKGLYIVNGKKIIIK